MTTTKHQSPKPVRSFFPSTNGCMHSCSESIYMPQRKAPTRGNGKGNSNVTFLTTPFSSLAHLVAPITFSSHTITPPTGTHHLFSSPFFNFCSVVISKEPGIRKTPTHIHAAEWSKGYRRHGVMGGRRYKILRN